MNFTYKEAVDYIEETPKFTTKNKLEHTKECLRRLGNPQEQFGVIHVAGTNGKGSVCAFLTSMLREAGYCCGLFTSPHLVNINERFQINEEPIDDNTFLGAFMKVKQLSDELVAEGSYHPTYFEFLFLMGMVIFADAGVEFVTLETGLGGRMDATNSVENPLLCVLTSISLDHMQYLGDTVTQIAGEKAGILKPGVPVVYDGNSKEAAAVIAARARELGCPAYEVREEDCHLRKSSPEGLDFSVENAYYGNTVFSIPFIGRYQMMNGAVALKAMEILAGKLAFSKDAVYLGMKRTRWQGRMETVLQRVVVDGAHNEDGVVRFVETACHFQEKYAITLLFSAVDDKDYPDMIREICENIRLAHVVTTSVGGYRAVGAAKLGDIFRSYGCTDVESYEEIPEAFEAAESKKGDGLLFCVGSLYLVGEIKDYIKRRA
ncbi:MAG: bifunctional folylpolyglutamate synthase/dihydrofolate synthase [Blautia sp.]